MGRAGEVKTSYLLTIGVVSYTKFSLLPWLLWDLHKRKYDSWSHSVHVYGLLLSALQCGHAMGQLLLSIDITNNIVFSLAFILLCGSYVGLCFISRLELVFCFLFNIGFAGSVLSNVSINLDNTMAGVSFIRKPTERELSNNLERTIICFAFATLLSGYLYDTNPFTRFPLHRVTVPFVLVCAFILLYFVCANRHAQRARQSASRRYDSVSSSSSNSNQNTSAVTTANQVSQQRVVNYKGEVPANFLAFNNNNLAAAQVQYGKRLQWRIDENIDSILTTPDPCFENAIKYYPHAIHGYSLDGCCVVYELLGQGDVNKLMASGVTIVDLVRHMVLRNEHVFERLLDPKYLEEYVRKYPQAIDPNLAKAENPHGVKRIMSILDLKDVNLTDFTPSVISFIIQSGAIIDNYCPNQVPRLVLCNASTMFSFSWATVASVLPASLTKKISIIKGVDGLSKWIHPTQRSKTYGGTWDVEVGQSEGHKQFLRLPEDWRNQPIPSQNVLKIDKNAIQAASKNTSNSKEIESYSAVGDQIINVPTSPHSPVSAGGIAGWWKKTFGKSNATVAYLGEKNQYRYNALTGRYELDFDDDDEDDYDTEVNFEKAPLIQKNTSIIMSNSQDALATHSNNSNSNSTGAKGNKNAHKHEDAKGDKKSKKKQTVHDKKLSTLSMTKPVRSTQELLEEHAVVFALQAAQTVDLEAGGRRNNKGLDSVLTAWSPYSPSLYTRSSGSHSGHNSRDNLLAPEDDHKRSWDLFVLVGCMHIISALVQGIVLTLLPVYLLSAVSENGLNYSVHDLALVLSTTSVCVLIWHGYFTQRLEYCLKASPVRTLRIACGTLALMCFLLPLFLYFSRFNTNSASSMLMASSSRVSATTRHIVNSNIRGGMVYDTATVPRDSYISLPSDSHHHSSSLLNVNYNPPSQNIINLVLTSLMLSMIVCSAYICRKATNILFHITLNSTFVTPTPLRCVVNHALDIFAPILSCFWLRVRHDSAFFLSLVIFVIVPVYIASIFLSVQFRGDYGVMTDCHDGNGMSSNRVYATGRGSYDLRLRGGRNNNNNSDNRATTDSNPLTTQQIFCLPMGDLSLLFSQTGYSYGSKLYNLRDDFKDL